MRFSILLAGPALFLAACGNDDQADNTINADESLSAESFSSNDLTAIDAVTGDASNMAADVDYVDRARQLPSATPGPSKAAAPSSARARPRSPPTPRQPAPEPAANSTAAATANNAL